MDRTSKWPTWPSVWGSQLRRWIPGFPWSLAIAAFIAVLGYGAVLLAQDQPVSISFIVRSVEMDQLQGLIDEFEQENPDIDINLIEGPNAADSVENLYTTSFLLGDSPFDLIYSDVVWIPKFAAAGWVMDLSERIEASGLDLDSFSAADLASGRYQDGLYRLPFRSDVGMLYYRTDIIDQLGVAPPETFEELKEIAQRAQAETDVDLGYVWQGLQYEGLVTNFVEIITGYGGFWIDADTLEVGLDQPEAVQAVEFLRSTIETGITPAGVTNYLEEDALRPFENGNAMFMRNWPYAWAEVNAEDSPVRGKVALKPMVHAPGQEPAACLGGWGFAISKSTPHPDEAWKVVEFFTARQSQKQFIIENAYVPSRPDLFTDVDVLNAYPHYEELKAVAEFATPRPPVGQYAQLSDILQRYLSSALTNQMTAEAAMEKAAGESRRVLNSGRRNADA
ncbi:ABC transporter substrate-binding protein [filamentous cyanobacterium CCP5]|nr:ABC transporter substrate-binding protein [filamentous cyanobacterium CCP5]